MILFPGVESQVLVMENDKQLLKTKENQERFLKFPKKWWNLGDVKLRSWKVMTFQIKGQKSMNPA